MRFGFPGLALASVFASGAVWAQTSPAGPALAPPSEVVLYVHADLKDDAFVDPLSGPVAEMASPGVVPKPAPRKYKKRR